MTNKERIQHPCPNCNAKAGEGCHDYTGKLTSRPHKTRGPGQLEAHLAAEAERTTERKRAPYGPLFAELAAAEVPTPSVDELKLKKRFEAAHGAETATLCSQPNRGLAWLRLWGILRGTAELIGEEWAVKVWDSSRRIYDTKEDYIEGHFEKALTEACEAKPMHTRLERRFDASRVRKIGDVAADGYKYICNVDGYYVVGVDEWAPPSPIMTRAEFVARFPRLDHANGMKDAPEVPSADPLFERTMKALSENCR